MATIRHLALVSDSRSVKVSDLLAPAAALQIQITRDFAPVWRRPATVASFNSLDDVPLDHWPLIVRDDIPYDAQGIHLDKDGSPFSLILYSPGWSLTTSHEALEMLADPLGKRTKSAPSIKPGQGTVRYLVEVCDPCEADAFAYEINGVTVSDFYFPSYFDKSKTAKKRYSFTGSVTSPRTVLDGGYISWQDPATGHWWQQTNFGSRQFKDLGVFAKGANPRRSTDGATRIPENVMHADGKGARGAVQAAASAVTERKSRAKYLRSEISRVVAEVS